MSNAEIRRRHDTLDDVRRELLEIEWPWREVTDLDAEVARVVGRMSRREDMAQLATMVRRGYRRPRNDRYVRFPRREEEVKGVEANWTIDIDRAFRSLSCPVAIALSAAGGPQPHRDHRIAERIKTIESMTRDRPMESQVFDCGHDIPGYRPKDLARLIARWVSSLET